MNAVNVIRMILFGISTLGYIFYLTKWLRMEFAAGFTFTAVMGCLFFAGILNALRETALLLFLGGLICFILCIKDRIPAKNLVNFGSLFLVLSGAALFFIVYNSRFVHQDIFDTWGTEAKVLIRFHRFPLYLDKHVGHKTYPVGAASWIYYWTLILGTQAEWVQIYAHNFFFLGLALSLFPLTGKRIGKVITAFVIIMMFCGNQDLFCILVDNLLTITMVSAAAFAVYYRNDLKTRFWWLIPWGICLPAIKSSGIVLAFLLILLLLPMSRLKRTVVPGIASGLTAFLWTKHAELVFPDALTSKHAVSLANYRAVLASRSREDIAEICSRFIRREFAIYNKFAFFLLLAVLLIVLFRYFRFRERPLCLMLCCYSVCIYLIYQTALLVFYIVSMPISEALGLGEYFRYQKTIVMVSAGVLLIVGQLMLEELPDLRNDRRKTLTAAAVMICFLGLMAGGIRPDWKFLKRQDPASLARRDYFEQTASVYQIPDKSRIMIFTDDGEDKTHYYMALSRYYFAPSRVNHVTPSSFKSWDQYDYVIVLTDSEEAGRFVKDNVPQGLKVAMP